MDFYDCVGVGETPGFVKVEIVILTLGFVSLLFLIKKWKKWKLILKISYIVGVVMLLIFLQFINALILNPLLICG